MFTTNAHGTNKRSWKACVLWGEDGRQWSRATRPRPIAGLLGRVRLPNQPHPAGMTDRSGRGRDAVGSGGLVYSEQRGVLEPSRKSGEERVRSAVGRFSLAGKTHAHPFPYKSIHIVFPGMAAEPLGGSRWNFAQLMGLCATFGKKN